MRLEAISSSPIACYLGEETNPHLTTASFRVIVENYKVPLILLFSRINNPVPSSASPKTYPPDLESSAGEAQQTTRCIWKGPTSHQYSELWYPCYHQGGLTTRNGLEPAHTSSQCAESMHKPAMAAQLTAHNCFSGSPLVSECGIMCKTNVGSGKAIWQKWHYPLGFSQ